MFRRFKKRQFSIVIFYFLLVLLGISILIDPVVPAKAQDVVICFLIISNLHFLNERKILFKRVKFFAEDIENIKNKGKKQEEFVAGITHDLKTPTIAQMKAIKLLLDNRAGCLNDEQEMLLKEVLSSCKYMSDMINTILYTYKYEGGETGLHYEHFDLMGVIHQVCSNLTELASENGQNIILNTKENLQTYADKLQIKRVVTNFISNAVKYGDKKQDIIVNIENKDNHIFFEVKNGFKNTKKEDLQKLFDKFSTSSKTSTGLGLYITKKIVERHNGKVFVKCEGNNIIFGFEIPLICTTVCAA